MNDLITILEGNVITLPQRAERVRSLVNVARGCIVEIGRELIEAKADVGHGKWENWLDIEFGWSQVTATKYMRVAEAFKSKSSLDFEHLTIDATALYALAAPEVPQSARQQAVEQAEAGEHITREHADKLIADAEKAMKRQLSEAIDAERKANAERIAKMNAQYNQGREALEQELERVQAEQSAPDVPQAIEMFCKILGKPKLTAKQLQLVAQVLDTTISDGKRTYPPVSQAQSKQAEQDLAIYSAANRAVEYFVNAPDPAAVRAAALPQLREKLDRMADTAANWLTLYCSLI